MITWILYTVFSLFIIKLIKPWIQWLYEVWLTHQAIKQWNLPLKYHWLLGNIVALPGKNEELLMINIKWTEMAPRKYCFYFGSLRPVLAVCHPETLKEILKTSEPKQVLSSGGYTLLLPWLGDGLLLASGRKWMRNRKLLTPGFHFDILKSHIDIHNTCTEIMMDIFQRESADVAKSVDISELISMCTLDIIIKTIFSSKDSIQLHDEHKYLSTVESLKKLIIKRVYNPLLYNNWIYNFTENGKEFKKLIQYSHQRSMKMIENRRFALKNSVTSDGNLNPPKCLDFLDNLILARDEDGTSFTDSEILDEVETFMFEGHDTTSSGILWLLYNLAKHPQYQKRAQSEIDNVLGKGNLSPSISWDDLNKLPYLTMCIKESLRSHPPVPFAGRALTAPITIDGQVIPDKTNIDILIWNVHHNPTVWGPDHMTFDPERFSVENISKIDPFAFIPFSAGPRNCIGQNFAMNEMKVVAGHILHRFEMRLDETHEVRMLPELILKAENGIKIYFTARREN